MNARRLARSAAAWAAAALVAGALFPAAGDPASRYAAEYAGSEKCGSCHQTAYKGWVKTFHSTVIQDAKRNPQAIKGDMRVSDLPFKAEEVYFTMGGHWDQRYLTRIGDDYYILPRLWSVQSRKWRPYSTYGWQKRPYSKYCVGCHSIGFDPQSKEIVEHAVGCESCHGPGAKHSADPVKENIIDPKTLSQDRQEEICASCHVRGKDTSGEYFFPIGWRPGEDLARFLVPIEKKEGESDHDAIHRLWDKWRADREAQARSRCEVCGIHQSAKPQAAKASADQVCLGCHEFEDRVSLHTHHKPEAQVGCGHCHAQKPAAAASEAKENDVHSYGYFLIHPQNCWDTEIHKRCAGCHSGKTEQWAYDIVESWKKPVVMDH